MRKYFILLFLIFLAAGGAAQSGFSTIAKLRSITITDATKDKTQAKVWTYANRWWCVLATSEGSKIFRLDGDIWTPVYIIAHMKTGQTDCLVSGDMIHILMFRGALTSYLYSFQYNPASNTYAIWNQRTNFSSLSLPSGPKTATLAIDSKGRMWIASGDGSNVLAWWSDAPYSSFSAPITIASGIASNDRYVITSMPGKIGIFWSNQKTKRFGFKTHKDGSSPNTWTADEVPASQSAQDDIGAGMASNQFNVQSTSDGTLYCAAKTNYNKTGNPQLIMLVRRPNGKWDNAYTVSVYPTGSQPTVLLNESAQRVNIVYTTKEGGGNIAYCESATNSITFGPAYTLINGDGGILDFSTSTHQPYPSNAVVIATNTSTSPYEAISVRTSDLNSGDSSAPIVLSINRQLPINPATDGGSVTYRITFSKSVTGVDAGDFKLTKTGTANGSISSVIPVGLDGFVYDVTVSSLIGTGDLRLDLKSTGVTIKDVFGNIITKKYAEGQPYTVGQAPSVANVIRGPYLQNTSGTSIMIRWRTDVPTDSKVVVGTTYGNYTISATDSLVTTEHKVQVTGLKSASKYFYRFGSSALPVLGDASYYFSSAPPTSTKQKLRFAAFGDEGSYYTTQSNVLNSYLRNTANSPADVMLILGDNAYEDGTDTDFQNNFFVPFQNTILKNHSLFPTPGNHEYHTTPQNSMAAPYFQNFSTPYSGGCGGVPSGNEGYYSFNWGNVHFLSLNSYGEETSSNLRLYDTLSPQVIWVKKDLEANTLPWTIVYFHHPPFTKGTRNSDVENELIYIRKNFIRILERYGVDLVLNGHSHVYERSYLLKGYYETEAEFNLSTDAVTASSGKYDGSPNSCPFVSTTKKVNHGTVYVVDGAASSVGEDVDPNFPHDALPFSSLKGSMFFLEIENNRLDGKCFKEDGTTIDQFTILKTVNKTSNISVPSGSSVTLKASWPGLYKWSTGDTTNSITVNPTSNVTYTVTDGMGCLQDKFQIIVTAAGLTRNANNNNNKWLNSPLIQVFPNIIQRGNTLTLRSGYTETLNASLMDENGRMIRSFKFTGTTTLETSNLATGVYFIMIKNKNRLEKQKIVITTN
ncbi:metallophosphoesterase [Flavisolibacter ginsengisoli]|jgi:predicted MPP superfamily phosphohydrolase|uniref:Por secretion system C-terminal sorting domain-containing protein n=1 Tax=Flavisolibacter ginsengisoli DSM 18119 TaxID=1121884 RepID=A0A1M5DQQ6_9BACT|nr:metallophosphoesterase [Flavisolibacter ginsengisoli]SHF69317.1 Por secretion system C-terminal sorting domain-containing protein [Flavisolibacter ginsengisoli DSM 18119]